MVTRFVVLVWLRTRSGDGLQMISFTSISVARCNVLFEAAHSSCDSELYQALSSMAVYSQ